MSASGGLVPAPVVFDHKSEAPLNPPVVIATADAVRDLQNLNELAAMRELRTILLGMKLRTRIPDKWMCSALHCAGLRAKAKCVCVCVCHMCMAI